MAWRKHCTEINAERRKRVGKDYQKSNDWAHLLQQREQDTINVFSHLPGFYLFASGCNKDSVRCMKNRLNWQAVVSFETTASDMFEDLLCMLFHFSYWWSSITAPTLQTARASLSTPTVLIDRSNEPHCVLSYIFLHEMSLFGSIFTLFLCWNADFWRY